MPSALRASPTDDVRIERPARERSSRASAACIAAIFSFSSVLRSASVPRPSPSSTASRPWIVACAARTRRKVWKPQAAA